MATRGSGVSKAEWDEVCKAANSGKSLKSWQWMLMTNEKNQKQWNTRHQVQMMKSTDEELTESKIQTRTTFTTWKPPHVETQSVQQLHLEDDYRRRCEQCVQLDIRGSMKRLRQHQQVRDGMVNVSRNELRPFWGSHESGQERLE